MTPRMTPDLECRACQDFRLRLEVGRLNRRERRGEKERCENEPQRVHMKRKHLTLPSQLMRRTTR